MTEPDAKDPLKAKVGRGTFHYVVIDGTDAIDSAVFGQEREKAGKGAWKNLLDALPDATAADEAGRKVDAAHDFLSLWKVRPSSRPGDADEKAGDAGRHGSIPDPKKGAVVVMPQGLNSRGDDPFWKNYDAGAPTSFPVVDEVMLQLGAKPKPIFGRHVAIQKSCNFMEAFMLNPAIKLKVDTPVIVDKASDTDATIIRAELVSVSSHGWLGGFMAGNGSYDWGEAQPASAQASYFGGNFFVVGRVARNPTAIFQGVRWLIMAQCSTVASAIWPMWASIFARSQPPVRGIIAYEEVAPGPGTASSIAKNFFDNLAAGQSFIEAWKKANNGNNWAALVHETAIKDGLKNFGAWASDLTTGDPATKNGYVGFLHSTEGLLNGKPTKVEIDSKDPFGFELGKTFHYSAEASGKSPAIEKDVAVTIEPWNLDQHAGTLWPSSANMQRVTYSVKITTNSPSETIKTLSLEWIHIRPSKVRINMKKIFDVTKLATEGDVATVKLRGLSTYVVTPHSDQSLASVKVFFPAVDRATLMTITGKDDDHIEAHHSYFWIRVALTTSAKDYKFADFTTRGLLFKG